MIQEENLFPVENNNGALTNNPTAGMGTNYSGQDTAYMIDMDLPYCSHCKRRAQLIEIREMSGAQIFWGCLLLCIAPCICWLPFCLSRCDDKRLECSHCHDVKDYYQAPFCPHCHRR
jgi:hypothetical protein